MPKIRPRHDPCLRGRAEHTATCVTLQPATPTVIAIDNHVDAHIPRSESSEPRKVSSELGRGRSLQEWNPSRCSCGVAQRPEIRRTRVHVMLRLPGSKRCVALSHNAPAQPLQSRTRSNAESPRRCAKTVPPNCFKSFAGGGGHSCSATRQTHPTKDGHIDRGVC